MLCLLPADPSYAVYNVTSSPRISIAVCLDRNDQILMAVLTRQATVIARDEKRTIQKIGICKAHMVKE